MGLSWLTWAVAIFTDHAVVSLAFTNLFHGIPFFVIVWHVAYERQRQQHHDGKERPSTTAARLSAQAMKAMTMGGGHGAKVYLLVLLALGAFESLLWELLIVKEYHRPEDLWPSMRWVSPTLEGSQQSMAVALVNLPQVRMAQLFSSGIRLLPGVLVCASTYRPPVTVEC